MRVAPFKLRIALLMVALAAAGGITATIAQGDDPPSTASFKTVDVADQFQLASGSGSATSANIVTGGTVTFSNSSSEMHNVDFFQTQSGVSCQQTAGGTSSSSLQFPGFPTAGTWAGVCTFARAGTYSFMCDQHEGMTGTVVVSDPGVSPGTTAAPVVTSATPAQTIPSSGPATTSPAASATPASSAAAAAPSAPSARPLPTTAAKTLSFRLGLAQRGSAVRGTISGARGLARVKLILTARRRDVGLPGRAAAAVGVGGFRALTTKDGELAFSIKLDGKASSALTRHGRLTVTLRVAVPPMTGPATHRAFVINLRRVGS